MFFSSKTERKIKFQQFQVALKLLAEKKYGSADEVPKLEEKILASKGPKAAGATVCLIIYYIIYYYYVYIYVFETRNTDNFFYFRKL